jgi:hypothetical protein
MNKRKVLSTIQSSLARPLVILDLDNTLICSVEMENINNVPHAESFHSKDLEQIYRVYQRPGLELFLDELFSSYDVAVWTAAGLTYALFIIDNFILTKKGRKLQFILWDEHCQYSHKATKKQQSKDLTLLSSFYAKEKFVLVDDNSIVLNQSGVINSILFDVLSPDAKDDRFLEQIIEQIHGYFE